MYLLNSDSTLLEVTTVHVNKRNEKRNQDEIRQNNSKCVKKDQYKPTQGKSIDEFK